jgi:hypothetical protein
MFTLTDKVLLDRAARMINASAKALRLEHEEKGWASTEAGRKAKQEYDRLLRDERDLRALGKRMCLVFDVKADRSKPVPQDTAEVGDPLNPLSSEARADYLSDLGPGSNFEYKKLEPFEGNPELRPAPVDATVEAQPHLGGEDVRF